MKRLQGQKSRTAATVKAKIKPTISHGKVEAAMVKQGKLRVRGNWTLF